MIRRKPIRETVGSRQSKTKYSLHRLFIDAPLNLPAQVGNFGHSFIFLLCITHPTPGIKPGSRIEMCDYSMRYVAKTLDSHPR